MEGLLDGTPVVLAHKHRVASLAGDGQRFRLFVDLINQAIQVRAGGCGGDGGHAHSVRDNVRFLNNNSIGLAIALPRHGGQEACESVAERGGLNALGSVAGSIPLVFMLNHWDIESELGSVLPRDAFLLGFPPQIGGGRDGHRIDVSLFPKGTVPTGSPICWTSVEPPRSWGSARRRSAASAQP